jgi:hypothetical protein
MRLATLQLIHAAEKLAALAEGLGPTLNVLNAESARHITKTGDSPVIQGNNLGVEFMLRMADINAAFVAGQIREAADEVRAAIDARVRR